MSENLLNVEDDGPDPAVAEAPAAPVAAGADPGAPAPEPEPEEPDAVEVNGQKMVPVGALIGERKQRQALQDKAARADELEAIVRDTKPYVDFLKANPGLINRQPQPPSPQSFGAPPDPQAEALAKTLDLYTPEGKPDLQRANQIRQFVRGEAQQMTNQAMAPIHQRTAQDLSAENFRIALTVKDAQGRSPSPQALTQIWRTMDPRQTADPNVASILALTALGLDSVSQKPAPVPPSQPPIVSEGGGGLTRRPALSALEANIARERGIPESKWQEHTQGFVKGRAQQLED